LRPAIKSIGVKDKNGKNVILEMVKEKGSIKVGGIMEKKDLKLILEMVKEKGSIKNGTAERITRTKIVDKKR